MLPEAAADCLRPLRRSCPSRPAMTGLQAAAQLRRLVPRGAVMPRCGAESLPTEVPVAVQYFVYSVSTFCSANINFRSIHFQH